ncbi:hypothetical protein OG742_25215 [Streptomyces sp. NBC_00828]|uniref:hypothetical protein n=1 Tax=Streptomyces sp. NBC_00828 TaxID=2903678 RepID=UPI003870A28B
MEGVHGGETEQKANLRALKGLVEAGDVPAVGVAGAVVGVPLDLDGQPLGSEEEVQVAAAAVGGTEFGLARGVEACVVQAQAGDRLGG